MKIKFRTPSNSFVLIFHVSIIVVQTSASSY